MDTLEIRKKIVTKFDASTGLSVLPLFTHIPYSKPGYRILSEYMRIENLNLKTFIYSLPVVQFPTFELTASDSEIQLQTLQLEWQSPRYHLNLVMSDDNTSWTRVNTISILNSAPMPFREFGLGNHELGDNSMLGFQVQNVGHGILSGNDFIAITADLIRTIHLEKISEGIALDPATINALSMEQLLNEDHTRTGFTIFNSGTTDIYLDIANTVSGSNFMVVIPSKGFYESVDSIKSSAIYAYSDATNTVHIREFF